MSATNFNTRNDTYRKLVGNGLTYRVPRFQRDYSWGEDEWDDLWQDILGTISPDGEPAHYMGYLVLQTSDDKTFDVIDGQQRLTTLSIIVLAALRNLKRLIAEGREVEATKQRLEGLRQSYVGYLDPVTLVPRSKLTLNRNNDGYYQTYLVTLADTLPQRGFKASEHLLRKAYEWYDRGIREYLRTATDPGLAVAQLIDTMSDRLFFTVITVTDELNAYKVFETLNARGVRLSATDLLKNYLFSVLHREGQHEHELSALDDRWERIVGRLGAESFPDFLRVHWISRRTFVRQADLFKTIRGHVRSRGDVFGLLQGMEEDMDTYLALISPDASGWPQAWRDHARTLRMFSVRQPLSLLLAGRRVLGNSDFETLLRSVVMISFRYNVIGNFQASEQERTYHAEADRIARGEHTTLAQILEGVRAVYPGDDAFRGAFTEKAIGISQNRNNRIVRYILCELEARATGARPDAESPQLSIEHICPSNPDGGWQQFTDEEVEALSPRLGNMILLETPINRQLGNAEFDVKRTAYAQSDYEMAREVGQNLTWAPGDIDRRQRSMAREATTIWRVPQLAS
ncbi:DUF262 domain-containing protein [Phenylobacterium sp. J367]|uniref:DUF262 domain-containing protein n=1 Tax=Phenylobacterium sp. J367 TaxID=2898435 RepID=UPI002151ACB1|nr:DUF262 domain-containing protein [Phenylobacterium sp. J367]MCR5877178.1 DUF262 domain-containing HNH endonuclease family protein [Phenylobacterium sp. J367]